MWHDGPLDALVWDGVAAVAWSVGHPHPSGADAPPSLSLREREQFAAGERKGEGERAALAQALIARLAGVGEGDVRLARTAAGAPVVAAPAGWHVGLSGRDGHHLIAAARAPVAADREPIDDSPPLWDMLTDAEAGALRRLPAAEQPRAWLRRWTIKEAHAKLIGEPRRIAPEEVETVVTSPERATATFEGMSRCWSREGTSAIETVALWA